MATKRRIGGYASQAAFACLLQSNRRMAEIAQALMRDYPSNLNARQIMLLGQLCAIASLPGAAQCAASRLLDPVSRANG